MRKIVVILALLASAFAVVGQSGRAGITGPSNGIFNPANDGGAVVANFNVALTDQIVFSNATSDAQIKIGDQSLNADFAGFSFIDGSDHIRVNSDLGTSSSYQTTLGSFGFDMFAISNGASNGNSIRTAKASGTQGAIATLADDSRAYIMSNTGYNAGTGTFQAIGTHYVARDGSFGNGDLRGEIVLAVPEEADSDTGSSGTNIEITTENIRIGRRLAADYRFDLNTETGQLTLNNYGSGTFTGTPAFDLSVDAAGNLIEEALPTNLGSLSLVAPTGNNGTAVKGDLHLPYADPWGAKVDYSSNLEKLLFAPGNYTYTGTPTTADVQIINGDSTVIDAQGSTFNMTGIVSGSSAFFSDYSNATTTTPRYLNVRGGKFNVTGGEYETSAFTRFMHPDSRLVMDIDELNVFDDNGTEIDNVAGFYLGSDANIKIKKMSTENGIAVAILPEQDGTTVNATTGVEIDVKIDEVTVEAPNPNGYLTYMESRGANLAFNNSNISIEYGKILMDNTLSNIANLSFDGAVGTNISVKAGSYTSQGTSNSAANLFNIGSWNTIDNNLDRSNIHFEVGQLYDFNGTLFQSGFISLDSSIVTVRVDKAFISQPNNNRSFIELRRLTLRNNSKLVIECWDCVFAPDPGNLTSFFLETIGGGNSVDATSEVIVRGNIKSPDNRPLFSINHDLNFRFENLIVENDGTVAPIQSSIPITIDIVGVFDNNAIITDPDITYSRLPEYGTGASVTTFYDSDGNVTTNRQVTFNNNDLFFDGTGVFTFGDVVGTTNSRMRMLWSSNNLIYEGNGDNLVVNTAVNGSSTAGAQFFANHQNGTLAAGTTLTDNQRIGSFAFGNNGGNVGGLFANYRTAPDASDLVLTTTQNPNTNAGLVISSVSGNEQVTLPDYGDGNITGTATYGIATDVNGNLIDSDLPLGLQNQTLSGNREVDLNGNTLTFDGNTDIVFGQSNGLSDSRLVFDPDGFTLLLETPSVAAAHVVTSVNPGATSGSSFIANAQGGTLAFPSLLFFGNIGSFAFANNRTVTGGMFASYDALSQSADVTFQTTGSVLTGVAVTLQRTSLGGYNSVRFNDYGTGTRTGTPASYPAFTADGTFIDSATPWGIATEFTPTGTADASGDVGDTAWDDNFFYVKTNAGWKRTALSTF